MTTLRDALADYLRIRRRLGFEMPQDGRLLEGFVGFLEQTGAQRITTGREPGAQVGTTALARAPAPLASAAVGRARVCSASGDDRPRERGFRPRTCCRARANAWRRTSTPTPRSRR